MKNFTFLRALGLMILLFLLSAPTWAQAPAGMTYQAILRDNMQLIQNESVELEFKVRESDPSGVVVYEETHSTSTNEFGLVNVVIGNGSSVTGTLDGIDWQDGIYYLEVKLKKGMGSLTSLGTTRLYAVPYSFYADQAGSVSNMDLDQLNDVSSGGATLGQVLQFDGTNWIPANDAVNDADADPNNELQNLSISGDTVFLSNGGYVELPAGQVYSGGSGISVTGGVITNTAPDQTVSLTGGGATSVTGTYPNFTITSTDQNTTYNAGNGISITGTTIHNTGDTNPADDITTTSTAGGDVSGLFNNLSVNKIRGRTVSTTVPASGQVLKWNGSFWTPSNDNGGLWNSSSGDVYYLSGDVGIGTSTPAAKLNVNSGDVLFGATSLTGNGVKMIWDISQRAFRAGYAYGNSWDPDSIGRYSIAAGYGTKAKAYYSVALGRNSIATGSSAFTVGDGTEATGNASVATGYRTKATASYSNAGGFYAEANAPYSNSFGYYTEANTIYGNAFGRYNVGAGSSSSWVDSDPIFEVGIGSNASARKNAITVLKDGRVGILDHAPTAVLDLTNDITTRGINVDMDPIYTGTFSKNYYGIYVDNYVTGSGTGSLAIRGAYIRGRHYGSTTGGGAYGTYAYGYKSSTSGYCYGLYASFSGNASSEYAGYFAGSVYSTGTYQTSDPMLKKNISPVTASSLSRIMKLPVQTYEFKQGEYSHMNLPEGQQTGFLATDVAREFPGLVKTTVQPAPDEEAVQNGEVQPGSEVNFTAVNYTGMIPHLTKAIQEQQALIEKQQQLIQQLEQRVKQLESKQ